MATSSGSRFQRAMSELQAEAVGASCCTSERMCGKHARIDAQVKHARAKHAWMNAAKFNEDVEGAKAEMDLAAAVYAEAVQQERWEELGYKEAAV